MSKKVTNPHDEFFHESIGNKKLAHQLLQQFLPKHIQAQVDLDTLSIWQNELNSSGFGRIVADVIYQAQIKGADQQGKCLFYFHIEQQRNPQRHLPIRILQYKLGALSLFCQQNPGVPLPPIYSMIIYNGTKTYPYTVNLFDMFAESTFAEETLCTSPLLIDLPSTEDAEIYRYPWSGSMLGLYKHIEHSDEIEQFVKKLRGFISQIEKEGGIGYIMSISNYILKASNATDYEVLHKLFHGAVSSETEEKIMTLAEHLEQRGIERGYGQGREQEKLAIAKSLLIEDAEPGFVVKTTGLDLKTVLELQASLDKSSDE
ncbi:MAG: Rpn family recombination-promoting nuclease/putative transposase [Gammaproteobacteria bacterium]